MTARNRTTFDQITTPSISLFYRTTHTTFLFIPLPSTRMLTRPGKSEAEVVAEAVAEARDVA